MSILNYAKQSSWPNGFGFQQSPIDLRQATTTADTDMTILTPVSYTHLTLPTILLV